MRVARVQLLAALVVVTIGGAPTLTRANSEVRGLVLIANADVDPDTVSRRFVAAAFLKKVAQWPSGAPIRPVDLSATAPLREVFVDAILKRSVSAVKNYWQQMIFSGRRLPPPEFDTEEQVIRYVARHSGAIGYVSAKPTLATVKVLRIEE